MDTTALVTASAQDILTPDMFQKFVNYIDVKPKTVSTYLYALKQFASFLTLNGIDKPQRDDIINYKKSLAAAGKKPTSIQAYLAAVKVFFRFTDEIGVYPNIAKSVKGEKLDREHKKSYLSSSQAKTVISGINTDTLQGKRDYAVVTLMITCGLRTIEVCRANIQDLDILGDNTVLYVQGKGRDERAEYVIVPEQTETAIRAYLKARGAADPDEPLFVSHSHNKTTDGDRLSTRTVSGLAKKAMVEAGYNSNKLTAHSLRHTAVTLALLNGNSLEEAQQFARHKDLATTMIYNHAIEKAQNKCSSAVAAALFS